MLSQANIKVVDSIPTLLSLLDNLTSVSNNPPMLYFNLEGVRLGRHGSISIISLYIASLNKAYLIDIHRLGEAAFSTSNDSSTSLKSILESPAVTKVIFDVRNASDALFSHYQISVDGIKDLQIMELACRQDSQEVVTTLTEATLTECVEKDSAISTAVKAKLQRMEDCARRLYDPNMGGQYEVFNERPIRPEIIQHCAQGAALLRGLYYVYNTKLLPDWQTFWRVQVEKAAEDRIKLSQSLGYDGQAKHKDCAAWNKWYIEKAIDDWNDEIISKVINGDLDDDYEMLRTMIVIGTRLVNDHYDSHWDIGRDCIDWEDDMMEDWEYF